MYLAGDGFSEIKDRDSLLSMPRKYDGYFDYIITNPPYGNDSPIINESIINSKRLEINFIIKIIKILKQGGKALLIIPDGVLESPSISHFREWILRQCKIDKIVGLPKFSFAPYTKEKTYALYLTKRDMPITTEIESIKNEEIWFYIVDNDGFANSDKRFPTNRKLNNGKWLHDELSPWIDSDGIEHQSILEQAFENKEQDENEEYFDEWNNKIVGKKYGRIKLKEIFKNEFVYYPTIPRSEIMKIINKVPNVQDLDKKELLKINIRKEGNTFYDLLNMKHKNLTVAEIKTLFSNIKSKKDILSLDGAIKPNFSLDLNTYGYEIKEQKSGLTINIWEKLNDAPKKISSSMVASKYKQYLYDNGNIIKDISDLLNEHEELKEQYAKLFTEHQIYYDIEDNKFYNHKEKISKKLFYLIPEKYFRDENFETIDLEAYKTENNILIKNIKTELNELLGSL